MFEQLENRNLFSTLFDNHILTITGSAANDNVVVQAIAGGLIQVTENGVPLVINARTDPVIRRIGSPAVCLEEAVRRMTER